MTTHIIVFHVAVIRARHAMLLITAAWQTMFSSEQLLKKRTSFFSINKCVRVCKLPKAIFKYHLSFSNLIPYYIRKQYINYKGCESQTFL